LQFIAKEYKENLPPFYYTNSSLLKYDRLVLAISLEDCKTCIAEAEKLLGDPKEPRPVLFAESSDLAI